MNRARQPLIKWLVGVLRRPGFWLILLSLALITVPHYKEALRQPAFLVNFLSSLGLERQAFERILYLAPIVWAGFLFGARGAVITSLAALAAMLPRAILISQFTTDSLFETGAVFVVGNVLAVSFESLRKERERRAYLTALDQTSSVISQSLDLNQILNSSIDTIIGVMKADVVLVFLLDGSAGELILTAHRGVSSQFASAVDRLKLGEGFNGTVAQTGEPLIVDDASQDPRLTRIAVRQDELRSTLIVPLRSKEKVNGTLCLAMHSRRQFKPEEMELLTAIGNQIGVAVENARLYQQQQKIAEQLRASEERYRVLFEHAQDAIWFHSLEGNIIGANRAAEKLSGFSVEELTKINVRSLLSGESLKLARQIRSKLLNGEPMKQPYEQRLIRKDGSEALVQLATSLVVSDGKVIGFQHIARDISEQKQMQDNLRFYLQQATRAQEEERKRISRELHDDTIQALVVLSRQLDALASAGEDLSPDTRLRLEELREQTNSIMRGVRRLSQDLRPAALDRLGLLPALEWLAADITEYSGITTKVNLVGIERRLPEEVELVLFRITQEALRNVWRHSGATHADICVEFGQGRTKISVSDNGKGFTLPQTIGDLARVGKLGLAGMQERARLIGGTLSVQSERGKGSTVAVELPA